MFWNNVKIALRNVRKNKLFAAINIIGLALGMTIYVLAGLIARYEGSHDAFFANSDRTYAIGIYAAPGAGIGFEQILGVQSAMGPSIEGVRSDVDAVARTIRNVYLVSHGAKCCFESVH